MGLEPPTPINMKKKTMIIDQQLVKKKTYFSDKLFLHLFKFFPSPNPNFGASWEEMGMNQRCFPLFVYFFSHFVPIHDPQVQISAHLGKKWGWNSHFFPPQIKISARFGEKIVLDPNRQYIHLCQLLYVGIAYANEV